MKDSIHTQLLTLQDRFEEINHLLRDPEVIVQTQKFMALSKEYAQLEPLVQCFRDFLKSEQDLQDAENLIKEPDPELQALAKEEYQLHKAQREKLTQDLQRLLLPKDQHDSANIYLEIRAGTGGDEASIFAGDLFRMYSRYVENQRWTLELITAHEGEHGGYKEIIAKISGDSVYSQLKFESGAHRVQRVPVTEAQGRIHTSACTVAIMPEVSEIESIDINPADLRVDTYRSSGAGGQHVNKTDSAIRITHIPTGVVVECQDERSQHKNRAKAMALLQARILSAEQEKQRQEQADTRKALVGSGDRSERIRTYNYPQGRVTDHRINLTLYQLEDIMNGKLELIILPLMQEHQAELLASLGEG